MAACMLRRHEPVVFEAQSSLPDNHGALLRFRSDVIERATGIELKKVQVTKAIKWRDQLWDRCTMDMANSYSYKVSGKLASRSIIDLSPGIRYIAPPDFLARLREGVYIEFDHPVNDGDFMGAPASGRVPMISTMPMPSLMDFVHWKDKPVFDYKSIVSLRAKIDRPDTDLYQTIYYPDINLPFYRASITGSELIVEYPAKRLHSEDVESDVQYVMKDFGMQNIATWSFVAYKDQKYGKLMPIEDDEARRRFILSMTDKYNVYSLGRFATWRQILLDDVVKDVGQIKQWITQRDGYSRRKHS